VKRVAAPVLRGAAAAALAAGLLCLAGAALADPAPKPRPPEIERATAEPANVRVQGDTVYYTGNLSKASSAAFDAAVAGVSRGQLTRLVMSSGGGDTLEEAVLHPTRAGSASDRARRRLRPAPTGSSSIKLVTVMEMVRRTGSICEVSPAAMA